MYTEGCIEWDSKEWDKLSLIGATREILEIRKEWKFLAIPRKAFFPFKHTIK